MSELRNTACPASRRRTTATLAAAAGVFAVAALAACSTDGTTAPQQAVAPTAAALSKEEGDDKDARERRSDRELDDLTTTFQTTSADEEAGVAMPLPLVCGIRGTYMVSRRIGRSGGSLKFGRSELKVPAGALGDDVQVSATIRLGESVGVEFAPHGLKFAKPAELRIDYTGCTPPLGAALNVYYTNDQGRIVQTMPSADTRSTKQIRALTDHFSGYAVSWGRSRSSAGQER